MDTTDSSPSEHHSGAEHKRVWRFLCVLLPSCAECGTQDADYFVRVPPGDLTYFADDELCPDCSANHGL